MKKSVIIILSFMVLFFYCSKSQDQESNTQITSHDQDHNHLHISNDIILKKGIKVAYPQVRSYVKRGRLTGVVKENKGSCYLIHSLVEGYVKSLIKDIGDRVKKWDILCMINSPELLGIKEDYIKAYVNYLKEQKNYKNAKILNSQNAIKQKEFIERETNYQTTLSEFYALEGKLLSIGLLEGELKRLKEAVKADKKDENRGFLNPYLKLRSPIEGIVLHQDLIPGEHVDHKKLLYKVANLKKIWVDFNAKEGDLPFIKMGQEIIIRRDIRGSEKLTGKIRNIGQVVDSNIRTVKVRIEVKNEGLKVKPGMVVSGYYASSDPEEELAVPREAVVEINGVSGVFLKDTDGFIFEPVQILATDFNNYCFIRGITLDSEVVVKGASYLKAQQGISTGETDPHAGHSH